MYTKSNYSNVRALLQNNVSGGERLYEGIPPNSIAHGHHKIFTVFDGKRRCSTLSHLPRCPVMLVVMSERVPPQYTSNQQATSRETSALLGSARLWFPALARGKNQDEECRWTGLEILHSEDSHCCLEAI